MLVHTWAVCLGQVRMLVGATAEVGWVMLCRRFRGGVCAHVHTWMVVRWGSSSVSVDACFKLPLATRCTPVGSHRGVILCIGTGTGCASIFLTVDMYCGWGSRFVRELVGICVHTAAFIPNPSVYLQTQSI